MYFRMIYDEGLAHASYLIGCQRTGEAIVIDPARDVDRYHRLAEAEDLRVVAAAETHIHADFVSGSRELAERGCTAYLSAEGGPDWQYGWLNEKTTGGSYDHRLLRDGDTFEVGNIRFAVIHTPGHTPEHLCFSVTDLGAGATEPIGVLSGDTLFVGDVGRPDLLENAAGVAGATDPSARDLAGSLNRLGRLDEYLQVWPAHGAGSACGKDLGAIPQSTIGYEKRTNSMMLAAKGVDAFVGEVVCEQPEPPSYFGRMKAVNRDGPPVLGALPRPRPIATTDIPESAVVVDTRPWSEFSAGHLPGSLFAPVDRQLSTIAGSYIEANQPVVLVASEGEVDEAVRGLVRVGIDQVIGVVDPLGAAGQSATAGEVTVEQARSMQDAGAVHLLDVRRRGEWNEGHAPGAIHAPHVRLARELDRIPRDKPVLCVCRSGKRSARAAALLLANGIDASNVAGGMNAWNEEGLPIEQVSTSIG